MPVDRRLLPANGRVAHESLRGQLTADRFVVGEWVRVVAGVADICDAPDGRRERQAIFGERFLVLERGDRWAFGQAARDGYVGYVAADALGPDGQATHWVSAPGSHLYHAPDIKRGIAAALTLGARLTVTETVNARFVQTDQGLYALAPHLRALGDWADDPVAVALQFLGTPYVWGGNSRDGIDCSGLVQAAFLACGLPCPADTDLQVALGKELPQGAALRRGDLVFWAGHVALVADPATLVHATAHFMATVLEPIDACIARVLAQGGGPVTARRRL